VPIPLRFPGGYDWCTMPFKSQAQRRKFAELLVEGKISPDTFEEWKRETGGAKLPERVRRKATDKRKAARKRTSAKQSRKGSSKRPSRKRTRR
jgi:hypothetical protein